MKTNRIIYYVAIGLFTLLMTFSVFNYFANNAAIREAFQNLGFPVYLIYPLAIAKILGLVALWTKRSVVIKEWAYAGFFFNVLLAFSAHINADDGQSLGALLGMIFLLTTYFMEKRVFPDKTVKG